MNVIAPAAGGAGGIAIVSRTNGVPMPIPRRFAPPPSIFPFKRNEFLRLTRHSWGTVQVGMPMTVDEEAAAMPPAPSD